MSEEEEVEEFNEEDVEMIDEDQDADGEEDEEDVEGEGQDPDQDVEQDAEGDADGDDEDEEDDDTDNVSEPDTDEASTDESGDEPVDEDEQDNSVEMNSKTSKGSVSGTPESRTSSLSGTQRSNSPASLRRQLLRIPPPEFRSYSIEPICAIPHPCPTNAMAASMCMTHLLTGSDDGFIRDYDIVASCNGRTFLTAPQRSHCGLGDTLMRAGSLRCWWPAATQDGYDNGQLSVVYSLACQSDALWALSGSGTGEIYLYTVRHDPGKVHHTFHGHDQAVTALALSHDETSVFSGSHDGNVIQWDLDRGSIAREFPHPGAQITSLGVKPHYTFTVPTSNTVVHLKEEEWPVVEEKSQSVEDPMETDTPKDPPITESQETQEPDAKSEASYDPLFDDVDGEAPLKPQIPPTNSLGLALPSSRPTTGQAPPMKHGANLLDPVKYAGFSNDLLMSASFDGSLFLWDRRVEKKVGRLENDKAPPWCISACWSASGNEILAGRRNATVDVFDVRKFGGTSVAGPRLLRTLVNPSDSKTVTCVAAFPDGRHMVCASEDNIRLWNVHEAPDEGWRRKGLPPFRIIPGHHGGLVSQILIDSRSMFMVTSSGARQWHGQSTKTVLVHELRGVW